MEERKLENWRITEEAKKNTILKTGWKALNRVVGGIWLGEIVCFAGRQRSYKTSILAKIPQWIVDHNEPPQVDKGSKPLILMISFEGDLKYKLFRQMYIHRHGIAPPKNEPSAGIDELKSYFNDENPYDLVSLDCDPNTMGFDEYVTLVENYRNSGYYLAAGIIDYLDMMNPPRNPYSDGNRDETRQELFRKMSDYHKSIDAPLFTAHSLNRGAPNATASDNVNPIASFDEYHLSGGSQIARYFDILVYLHVERSKTGSRWLAAKYGKVRYRKVEECQQCSIYPLDPEEHLDRQLANLDDYCENS